MHKLHDMCAIVCLRGNTAHARPSKLCMDSCDLLTLLTNIFRPPEKNALPGGISGAKYLANSFSVSHSPIGKPQNHTVNLRHIANRLDRYTWKENRPRQVIKGLVPREIIANKWHQGLVGKKFIKTKKFDLNFREQDKKREYKGIDHWIPPGLVVKIIEIGLNNIWEWWEELWDWIKFQSGEMRKIAMGLKQIPEWGK